MGTKRAQAAESIHPGDAQNTGGLRHASTAGAVILRSPAVYAHYSANLGLSWSDGIAIATSVIGFAYLALADRANPSIYAPGSPGNCSYTRFDSEMRCRAVRLRHDQCQANREYVAFETEPPPTTNSAVWQSARAVP